MSICYVDEDKRYRLNHLVNNWNETMIFSCIQGHMGKAYVDDLENPMSVMMVVADFCFLAGKPNEELVRNRRAIDSDFIIMVSDSEEWNRLIEKVYPENSKRVTRYAIKKEGNIIFSRKKLIEAVDGLNLDYELKMIDKDIYKDLKKEKWSMDLCSHYKNAEDFCKNGIGVAVFKGNKIVAGVSSYTYYDDGIEIEIDTKEEFRRKGLAYACASKLILECMDRNLYPSWDAQNLSSVALAEKLGYHFDHEYPAYEIIF